MSKKILIVEDEFVVANDLRLILRQAGYRVTGIAISVEEADEQLKKHKPDLVILDIRLEGKLSGIDFARKLKAENRFYLFIGLCDPANTGRSKDNRSLWISCQAIQGTGPADYTGYRMVSSYQ